jgi:hypothetical protein
MAARTPSELSATPAIPNVLWRGIWLVVCLAAAFNLWGPLRSLAIGVAAANALTYRGKTREDAAANLVTGVAGLGLLIYSFAA